MNFKSLLIWLVLAYGFCLVPSSCFSWFSSVSVDAGESSIWSLRNLSEWAAHAVLLGGVAFCLMRRLQIRRGLLASFAVTMLLVLLIAVSIEWFQGLLPEEFHRGPSISDVWASLAGGLLGGIAAIIRRSN